MPLLIFSLSVQQSLDPIGHSPAKVGLELGKQPKDTDGDAGQIFRKLVQHPEQLRKHRAEAKRIAGEVNQNLSI